MEVPFLKMFFNVIFVVIVPLFLGFTFRQSFKNTVGKILPVFPAISVTFIIFICSLVIALNRDHLAELTLIVFVAVILLNIYGMLCGYSVATGFKMAERRRRTLTIEIGMQNAGLGTALALEHFGERAALPAAVFVFVCIITASVMSEVWQKKSAKLVAG